MGVDIQVVLEYDHSPAFGTPHAVALLSWPRQRALFGAMGYRGESILPVKGFPAPVSWTACHHHALHVVDEGDVRESFEAGLPAISEAEALEAVEAGRSQFLSRHGANLISHPEHLWPNWLTLAEFRQCAGDMALSLECELTLGMMEALERRGLHARIVFWFDA